MSEKALAEFADSVARLMPDIMREFLRRQTKEVAEGNITLPQVLILDVLKDSSLMRMGQLAGYLGVSMAASTGIVDRLVRGRLVSRSGSADDRRIVNISITAKGRKIIARHNQAKQKAFAEMFRFLSPDDRQKYLEILKKIHQHFNPKFALENQIRWNNGKNLSMQILPKAADGGVKGQRR